MRTLKKIKVNANASSQSGSQNGDLMQGEEGEDDEEGDGELIEGSGLHRINEEGIIMEEFKYEEDDVDR
jgi:hypothetical protein